MNITRYAIEKNRITTVALFIILMAGLMSFQDMPRAEDPGFIIRWAQVITYFPGAGPDRVEMLVTDKLEKAIKEIPELDYVESESRTNVSVVMVAIKERYREMRPIWDDLRRKIERVESELPDGIIGPIVNDEFGDVFGTVITLTGEGFSYAELKDVADEVRDELLRIGEVAKVDIYGAQEERIFVEYNNARLAELGLSPIQLSYIMQSRNIIIPGGNITTTDERIVLEPTGNFESVEDLRRSVVTLPNSNEVVYLEDVADIYRDYVDPPSALMRSSGVPALGLAVSMREGGNIITLGAQVKATVDRLRGAYSYGIEFDIIAFQPEVVDRKVMDFIFNLLQAVGVVIAVMLIFLGIRTGLVVASLIPSALIMAILFMSLFGIGLDQVSLASLIIALGMLVDNAIVMSESTMVQMAAGKKPIQAAIDSAKELRIPLLTSSLTTAAAFLPIFLAESMVGEYTSSIFKVVTITLLCSWVLALTIIPMLCVLFLKVKHKTTGGDKSPYSNKFYSFYRGLLQAFLRHRVLTIAAVAVVFVIAMMGFTLVPKLFFPETEDAFFTAEFELPIGTPIEKTDEIVTEIEKFIREELTVESGLEVGITNWGTFVGQGGPRFVLGYSPKTPSPEYAFMLLNVSSTEVIDEMIDKIENFCFERYPELRTDVKRFSYGPPVVYPVAVRLSGRDKDRLFAVVDDVKARLAQIPGTRNIGDNWGHRTKKLLVKINQPRARSAGVSNQDVAVSLQAGLSGIELTQYREEDRIIPVTLRSVAADRHDIGKLETLNVFSQLTGRSVPLKQVADVEVAWEPSKILRRDQLKTVTVYSYLRTGVTAAEVIDVLEPWMKEESAAWPPGYTWELGGEDEESEAANQSIGDKMPIAGLIILVLLVWQFNSLRRSLIILITIPLGLIGVVVGLLVAKSYFGFMTLLGVVSLAGIVINNAIVLLERIKLEREEHGLPPQRAIIEAAQRRLRPILLTTATTVCGLVPLWLGGGAMWEPMAIAIIFGLIFATVLTLGVVPVLYSLFFKVKFKDFEYSAPSEETAQPENESS